MIAMGHATWAGYTSEGMDPYRHIHPHPDGKDYDAHNRPGFGCAAPINITNAWCKTWTCADPPTYHYTKWDLFQQAILFLAAITNTNVNAWSYQGGDVVKVTYMGEIIVLDMKGDKQ